MKILWMIFVALSAGNAFAGGVYCLCQQRCQIGMAATSIEAYTHGKCSKPSTLKKIKESVIDGCEKEGAAKGDPVCRTAFHVPNTIETSTQTVRAVASKKRHK